MRIPAVRVIFVLTIIVLSTSVQAQWAGHSRRKFNPKYQYISVGGSVNAMNYVGEVDPAQSFISPAFRYTRLNFGVEASKRINANMTYRLNLSWGRIKGNDAINSNTKGDDLYRHVRNLSFRNDIIEFKADVVYDLFGNPSHWKKRHSYTPYGFIGLAVFKHNPRALFNGEWVALRPLGTEGQFIDGVGKSNPYSLIQIAIPLGVGVRYKLDDNWDLAFEIGWRYTFTDYLDDISTEYVDKANFTPGSDAYFLSDRVLENQSGIDAYMQARPDVAGRPDVDANGYMTVGGNTYVPGYGMTGDQRGDKNKDWYVVTGIHLTYILHPKVICPKFR